MTLRNRDYGPPKPCENPECDRTRGASLKSVYHHGCVLCVSCENKLQLGELSLPESATEARKQQAEDKLLGA